MKRLIITEEIWQEGKMYLAYCPELDIAGCGSTVEEAKKNLREVIQIQIEETSKLGTLKEFLEGAGYDLGTKGESIDIGKKIVGFNQIEVPVGAL